MTYFPDVIIEAPIDDKLLDLHVACQFSCDTYPLVDSSFNGVTPSTYVGAALDTGVKKYGTGSLQLTSGYVDLPAVQWGYEPWTVEGWFRWDAHVTASSEYTWLMHGTIAPFNTQSGPDIFLNYSPSGQIFGGCSTNGYAAPFSTGSVWTVGDTAFHHIALQRRHTSSTAAVLELYFDGVPTLSTGLGITYSTWSTSPTRFGWGTGGTTTYANIHIDSLRITTGVCRYSANFASNLPGALTACSYPTAPITGEVRRTSIGAFYECVDAGTNTWRQLVTL